MKQVHQTLHLQHHRHTGRVLHHRHTSWRGLALVLGLAAVGVVGLNIMARVTAEELYVYARIQAPVPTVASIITNITDGATVHKQVLQLRGSCASSTPPVIVQVVDNGSTAGSVACAQDNTFTLAINLQAGLNTLLVRTYNITDDMGPDSASLHITYIPPPAAEAAVPASAATAPPLQLTPGQNYIVYGPSRDASWSGAFLGGVPPYTVFIDWGDARHDTLSVADGDQHTFTHHYKRMKPYDVQVRITDTLGNALTEHFAAVTPYIAPVVSGNTDSSGNSFWNSLTQTLGGRSLFGLYGSYLIVLVIFAIAWRHRHPFAYAKVPARQTHRHRTATQRRTPVRRSR